jgi:hypothetical protein
MSPDRILIRSTLRRWPLFLLGGLGVVGLVGAGIIATQLPVVWPALIVAGFAVLALLVAIILELRRVQQLMWLTLTDKTFTVLDSIGERTFHDDDVVSMALRYRENFENGILKSVTRIFRVWIVTHADRPELIEMTNTMKLGAGDPLAVLIDRITRLLKHRAHAERDRGQSILGEGWELLGRNLTIRRPSAEPIDVSLDDIVAADYIENQLRLWRKDHDESFAEIPLDAANCHLLKVLLDDEIVKRPETDEPPHDGGLGRIIFERKPSRNAGIALSVFGVLLLMASAGLGIGYLGNPKAVDAEVLLIGALITLGLALLFFFITWYVLRYRFRCQAFGVSLRTIFGEKSLRFPEVEVFTYSATRHFHNGVYTGTHLSMSFLPFKEAKKPKIVYSTQVKNVDSSLDEMRDQIAGILAGRLLAAVRAGQTVEWTPNLTLEPDGLRYRPAGLLGRKAAEFLPYSLISSQNMHQGTYQIYQRGKPKPIVTEASSARHFFPGYFAFLNLLEDHPEIPTAPVEVSSEEVN